MKDNQNDLYETSDLGIAAYFVVKGQQLISAEKRPGRYSFTFLGKDECQKLAVEYVNAEFSRFDAALKNLKSLIK
jgi:hypothetical protein